jgi:Tfp pilus assembly PilM family ATPase
VVTFRKKGWIGVDIGTRSIKLAQVEQAATGLRLSDSRVIPRRVPAKGDDTDASCPVRSEQEIRSALSLGRGFSGRAAACALSMRWCQAKSLTVPAGSKAEQRSIVAKELRNRHADGSDEQEFDFWHTGAAETDSEIQSENVIAMTIPHRWAVQIADDVRHSGLICHALDGLPLALARAVWMSSASGDDQASVAVDWGFSEATFCTVTGGQPTFVRRLRACGFGSVLQAICRAFDVSLDEAELLVNGSGLPGDEPGQSAKEQFQEVLFEVAADPLSTMVEELGRTLGFLKRSDSAAVPGRMWLFGAGALWKGANEFLSSRINHPVETWSLETAGVHTAAESPVPAEILAPAIALSSLAWETQ